MYDTSAEEILERMIQTYQETYLEETGEAITLKPADPVRIELYTIALLMFQERKLIEYKQKQNLLEYAEGDMLEGLGKWFHLERLSAQKAKTKMRLVLSTILASAEVIPAGTRFSDGKELFFSTIEQVVIPAGVQQIDVMVEAVEAGEAANGLLPGQINNLVDPLPYIFSVSNLEKTQGGAEIETDKHLRERIYLFWTGYSVAGPDAAYIYHVKNYSQAILDVRPESPTPGRVNIYLILADGEFPEESFLEELNVYLEDYRPLTDQVILAAPEPVEYDLKFTYYLEQEQLKNAETIKVEVQKAAEQFIYDLQTRIGKNINPDDLIKQCKQAGAARLEIQSPVYTKVPKNSIARLNHKEMIFGGVEDG